MVTAEIVTDDAGTALAVIESQDSTSIAQRGDVFDSPLIVNSVEKIARMLAYGAFTPQHLKHSDPERTVATCFRIAAQAYRWKVDPFALADDTYECRGKLGYGGKIIASIVNTRAGLDGRLTYTFRGDGDDRTVTVSGRFKGETEVRTVELSVGQAKTSNQMWTKDPDQKLCYSGALKWARRHCPEIVTGVLTVEDLEVIAEGTEPPPAKSEEEVNAERKAKAAEKAAAMAAAAGAAASAKPAGQPAASSQPTTTPTNNPLFAPITDSDKAQIKEVIAHKGIGESEIAAAMVRAIGSAKKLSTLTRSEAAAFHAELLLVGEESAAAASTPTTPASQAAGAAGSTEQPAQPTGHRGDQLMDRPAPEATATTTGSTTPGSATAAQCARIRELAKLTDWQQEGPGGIKETLAECKAANVRGLSESQAAAIIAKREAMLAGVGAGAGAVATAGAAA